MSWVAFILYNWGENLLDDEMYDNWLFLTPFLLPLQKGGKKKGEWSSKTGLKPLFIMIQSIFTVIGQLAKINGNDERMCILGIGIDLIFNPRVLIKLFLFIYVILNLLWNLKLPLPYFLYPIFPSFREENRKKRWVENTMNFLR